MDEVDLKNHPEIDLSSDAFQSNKFVSLKWPDFRVVDEFIYHHATFPNSYDTSPGDCWKLLVPESLRQSVTSSAHDPPTSAYCGMVKCLDRFRRRFYWKNMVIDIRDYIQNCETCQTTKYPNRSLKRLMGAQVQSKRILDHFSKFTFLKAVEKFNTKVVINLLLDEIFSCFGVPETVVSDNETQFKSRDFSDFFRNMAFVICLLVRMLLNQTGLKE